MKTTKQIIREKLSKIKEIVAPVFETHIIERAIRDETIQIILEDFQKDFKYMIGGISRRENGRFHAYQKVAILFASLHDILKKLPSNKTMKQIKDQEGKLVNNPEYNSQQAALLKKNLAALAGYRDHFKTEAKEWLKDPGEVSRDAGARVRGALSGAPAKAKSGGAAPAGGGTPAAAPGGTPAAEPDKEKAAPTAAPKKKEMSVGAKRLEARIAAQKKKQAEMAAAKAADPKAFAKDQRAKQKARKVKAARQKASRAKKAAAAME